MNEVLDRIIRESGEMWSGWRDRTANPVLVKLDEAAPGKLFELTLPPNEGHPFWRINERGMTPEEVESFLAWKADHRRQPEMTRIGGVVSEGEGHPVRGFIFNGRAPGRWVASCEGFGPKAAPYEPAAERVI